MHWRLARAGCLRFDLRRLLLLDPLVGRHFGSEAWLLLAGLLVLLACRCFAARAAGFGRFRGLLSLNPASCGLSLFQKVTAVHPSKQVAVVAAKDGSPVCCSCSVKACSEQVCCCLPVGPDQIGVPTSRCCTRCRLKWGLKSGSTAFEHLLETPDRSSDDAAEGVGEHRSSGLCRRGFCRWTPCAPWRAC